MHEPETLDIDPLFLGLTRPTMVRGVTYTFFFTNMMLTMMVFVGTGSLLTLLVGVPVHLAGYALYLKDPRLFDIWWVRLTKASRVHNYAYWGTNSYSP